MTSKQIRQAFLDFFAQKDHKIVPSAPMVIKDDPTLMFTNAGMNQFKDIFLGLRKTDSKRVANSQKCLRVSGKHNDLEEVGKDTYHHTMFEMLGNWSFGDYFKKEAIQWAWEFLTEYMKLPKDRLYATYFEGDETESIPKDTEAQQYWLNYLPQNHVIAGSKKDNFWEMGDTGPCGPCSEIHIDLRDDSERITTPGHLLVNKGNPLVIEIWNLVFIQYNRKADGALELLPDKHVDTGMGFERLCMVVQGKKSNYDTDLFQPIIADIEKLTSFKYGQNPQTDIAFRVLADHIRAISFSIADGQLPSNEKAGYVIRRILRRAVRYYFSFLNQKEPLLYKLVPALISVLGDHYTELKAQKDLIMNVILEEENAFLKTLDTGIKLLSSEIEKLKNSSQNILDGKTVFTLYDAYGFPPDLTELILQENGMTYDKEGFTTHMNQQKERSRANVKIEAEDWNIIRNIDDEPFIGYDTTEAYVNITRWRKVKVKGKEMYQIIFDKTPFYGESGGQVGDRGTIEADGVVYQILDTIKEHNLNVHLLEKLPEDLNKTYLAKVDVEKRQLTAANHSATHLLHYALRTILGKHVEQKGSLVDENRLRFDFSHYQKLSNEEIRKIEQLVNELIRKNIKRSEYRDIPITEAQKMGAIALFGEKYGEKVRVINFGESIELCGGTHVESTGQIGMFKIISESAISAGVRRIEAITSKAVENLIYQYEEILSKLTEQTEVPITKLVEKTEKLINENKELKKKIEEYERQKLNYIKNTLKTKMQNYKNFNLIVSEVEVSSADALKSLCYELKGEVDNIFLVLGAIVNQKPFLAVMLADEIVKQGYNASNLVKELAKEIEGGGGGQPFFATAGGKKIDGLKNALKKVFEII